MSTKTQVVFVRMEPELKARVLAQAQATGSTLSQVVREALLKLLSNEEMESHNGQNSGR